MNYIDIDPRLSEFSREELNDAGIALLGYIADLQKHTQSLSQTPDMARMFEKEIMEWETRIENIQAVHTQLLNAQARKDMQTRVASN